MRHGLLAPLLCGTLSIAAVGLVRAGAPPQDLSGQAAQDPARLEDLRREADGLAAQEKTLLNELRRLELERQIKSQELAAYDKDLKALDTQLAQAQERASALREAADVERPEVEARLVRLYKMGRGGHWRLLLATEDVRAFGRAYRLAATMMAQDRDTLVAHATTLERLDAERDALEARARQARQLRDTAAAARAALDRAVSSHTALIASIRERRDLAAQLGGELQAAERRLQRAATEAADPGTTGGAPLQPLRGTLPWPAEGFVVGRFGSTATGPGGVPTRRNGIELSLAEGRPVRAVHDGVVTLVGPFSGYGRVVVLDHGDAQSLYAYLTGTTVAKGARVTSGGTIGFSGRNLAGNPSLYFELQIDGKPVDPLQWLRKAP